MLAVLETTHKPVKPPTNQPKHPQTSQTTHKPFRNQPNRPQTTQRPAKPLTNQPNIGQTTEKPANYEQKISFLCYQKLQQQCKTCAKFATILLHFINIAKIKAKQELRESDLRLFKRQPGKSSILHCSPFSLHFEFFCDFFSGKSRHENQSRSRAVG